MRPDINKILDQRSIRTANTSRAKKKHIFAKKICTSWKSISWQSRPISSIFSISTPTKSHHLKSSLEHLLKVKTNFVYIFHLHTTNMPSFKKFLRASLDSQDQFRLHFPSPHHKKPSIKMFLRASFGNEDQINIYGANIILYLLTRRGNLKDQNVPYSVSW